MSEGTLEKKVITLIPPPFSWDFLEIVQEWRDRLDNVDDVLSSEITGLGFILLIAENVLQRWGRSGWYDREEGRGRLGRVCEESEISDDSKEVEKKASTVEPGDFH